MKDGSVEIVGQDSKTLHEFVRSHRIAGDGQRLGQRFVNIYMSQPLPELFHEKSDWTALGIIVGWLDDHQYFNTMSPLADKRS